jgi:hypothetical protein
MGQVSGTRKMKIHLSIISHLTKKATQKNGIVNAKNIKEIALMF